MTKLIKFTDVHAYWSNEPILMIGSICRYVKNFDLLPDTSILEFNCKEDEIGPFSSNREEFKKKIQEFLIPDINISELRNILKNKELV